MKKNIDEKLALNEKIDKIDPHFLEISRNLLLKRGHISNILLINTLRCSESEAKEIIEMLLNET